MNVAVASFDRQPEIFKDKMKHFNRIIKISLKLQIPFKSINIGLACLMYMITLTSLYAFPVPIQKNQFRTSKKKFFFCLKKICVVCDHTGCTGQGKG